MESDSLLVNCTTAVGLASLANAGNAASWMREAWKYYGKALRQLRVAMGDAVKITSDETLAATALLWMFDVCHSTSIWRTEIS